MLAILAHLHFLLYLRTPPAYGIPPKIRSLNAAHVLQKNALKVNFQHFFLHMCIFCSTFAAQIVLHGGVWF